MSEFESRVAQEIATDKERKIYELQAALEAERQSHQAAEVQARQREIDSREQNERSLAGTPLEDILRPEDAEVARDFISLMNSKKAFKGTQFSVPALVKVEECLPPVTSNPIRRVIHKLVGPPPLTAADQYRTIRGYQIGYRHAPAADNQESTIKPEVSSHDPQPRPDGLVYLCEDGRLRETSSEFGVRELQPGPFQSGRCSVRLVVQGSPGFDMGKDYGYATGTPSLYRQEFEVMDLETLLVQYAKRDLPAT